MEHPITEASSSPKFPRVDAAIQLSALDQLCSQIERRGFAVLPARRMEAMAAIQDADGAIWREFAESWERLGPDDYMRDGGTYRKRRHAVYSALGQARHIHREPNQPHYRGLEYNHLNGGIARHYLPIEDGFASNVIFRRLLDFCRTAFDRLRPESEWHIEVHQFRIEAREQAHGRPTPEGVHRDGVHYVLMLMVRRSNIVNGATEIHSATGGRLDSFVLNQAWDAAIVDDERVRHGVTPIIQLDTTHPGTRDVLVITFRAKQAQ